MVPDLEELGGRDLHALQVGLRRHGGGVGGAERRGGARRGAVRSADSARGRRSNGGGDCDDGSSRHRPAEGYLWGRPGRATPLGAALLSAGSGASSPPCAGGPGSPAGGTGAGDSPAPPSAPPAAEPSGDSHA